MNRNLKNEEVKKYITIGAVLIILYWALQNLQLIFSVMSKILTLFIDRKSTRLNSSHRT